MSWADLTLVNWQGFIEQYFYYIFGVVISKIIVPSHFPSLNRDIISLIVFMSHAQILLKVAIVFYALGWNEIE